MINTESSIRIDYFNIEGTPGGNQDWCTDFWMHLGGCAALAACDLSICLSKNLRLTGCCPYDPENMTKKAVCGFFYGDEAVYSPEDGRSGRTFPVHGRIWKIFE